jgi:hypothetical protein
MQIAIIGAGRVDTTLGRRLAGAGHTVTYGVRTPDDPKHAGVGAGGAGGDGVQQHRRGGHGQPALCHRPVGAVAQR